MNTDDDFLSAALRTADAAAPPPPAPSGLAQRVRVRAQRRSRRRRMTAGSIVLVAAVASVFALVRTRPGDPHPGGVATTRTTEPRPIEADLARLAADARRTGAEARTRLATVRVLAGTDRRPRRNTRANEVVAATAPTQANRIAMVRDEAAFTLVSHADRLSARANAPDEAIAAYRRAAELFPESQWAQVARQRAEKLESHNRI